MQLDLVDRVNFATLQMGCFSPLQFFGKGLFLKLAGLHYSFPVVNQTPKASGAKIMPCRQSLKIGQMIPCEKETL